MASSGHPDIIGNCARCKSQLSQYSKIRECDSRHKVCVECLMCILDESEDGKVSCPECNTSLRTSSKIEKEPVYVFVDNSNIWTEAKKKVGRDLQLKCSEDPRVRIHTNKLVDVVSQGRLLARGKVYGSEPPAIHRVWTKMKRFEVEVFQRSVVTGKEKQVDQQLVADITKTVCDHSNSKGTIAIVCGDADVLPAVRETVERGWKCEVWIWKRSCAQAIKKMEKEKPNLMKVFFLDNYTNQITFTDYKLDLKCFDSDKKRTSVVIVEANEVFPSLELTNNTEWQDELSTYLEWPFQYFLTGKKHSFNDLVLVFQKLSSELKFDEIITKLFRRYGDRAKPFVSYSNSTQLSKNGSGSTTQTATMISNRFHVLQNEAFEGSAPITDSSEGGAAATEKEPLNDGFQIVKRKQRTKGGSRNRQLYSDPCPDRARCKKIDCFFFHTKVEREFFRSGRNKCFPCYTRDNCKKGVKCIFAHDKSDSFCCFCCKWGHLEGEVKKEKCFKKKPSRGVNP